MTVTDPKFTKKVVDTATGAISSSNTTTATHPFEGDSLYVSVFYLECGAGTGLPGGRFERWG